MPLVNFSNVDFEQIKASLRDYLKANSNFTDYDYEGSNLSTIINTLAYNTYLNSYNANMVTNEVFIDSATLRENVVSLARNIGYVPRSRKAAVSNISFSFDASDTNVVSVTLKAGIVGNTSKFNRNTFTFSIPDDITVPVNSSGYANFNNIDVYEGAYITQTFSVSSRTPNQKYILTNAGIDSSLIRVNVKESERSSVQRSFKQYNSLIDLNPNSAVYFLQETEGERYELMFGDGILGVGLQEPNFIEVGYVISNGEDGNGIQNMRFSGSCIDQNGAKLNSRSFSAITVNEPSYGGSSIESVESIKTYAPMIYSSQNRAVTSSDYEALIPKIYPETESVSAYGGETMNPPQYGKVLVSIKPTQGIFVPESIKENIRRELRKYTVAGIDTEIIDLKYLYVEVDTSVYYNSNLTPSGDFVRTVVNDNIQKYANSTQLNKFGARFKYSKFQKIVDDSNESITSNITTVRIRRDLEAKLNQFADYEICFGNRFHIRNHGTTPVYNGTLVGYNIRSTGFKVSGINDTVYLGDQPNSDLSTGTVFLFKLNSPTEPVIVKRNVGVIDYVKGEIRLSPIKIISTLVNRNTPLIEISAIPHSNDVIGLQDLYLQLDSGGSQVRVLIDQISTGENTSGTNYLSSSSYSSTSLVRGVEVVNPTSTVVSTTSRIVRTTPTSVPVTQQSVTLVTPTPTPSSPTPSSPTPSPSPTPSGGGGGGGSYSY